MKNLKKITFGLSLSLFTLLNLVLPAVSSAQQAGSGQAIEIAPPVITLSANPGDVVKTQISLRDISTVNLVVNNEINDFTAAGEDGTPKIYLEADETSPFSLKGWINPIPAVTLTPRQIKSVNVSINVPKNASPGGHYGVIRFTASAPSLNGNGVALSTSLGSLVLINVSGNVKESLAVEEMSINKNGKKGTFFESAPLNFVQRIKNTGNTHLQPTGQVEIKDMFGKKVAAVNVNSPPRNVLPSSIRKFEEPLDKTVIGNKRLFGRYTATMKLTYGNDKKELTAKMSFWVIPYKLVAIVIGSIIVLFFGLRFALKRYNQRIINRSRRR